MEMVLMYVIIPFPVSALEELGHYYTSTGDILDQYELADCLHVSEEYLQEAIDCYREKYGCSVEVDGYLIVFEPCLAVYERFEDTEPIF